jgi:gamma-glutamyltranspeptidase/glutathione hydrolase
MIVGSPGGSTIITTVFQNILNVLEFEISMQTSVDAPRFHHQWMPDFLFYEEGFFNYADSLSLLQLGQNPKKRASIGRVDAIAKAKKGGWEIGADKRGDDYGDGY